MWSGLPEQERREWENKAREEERRQIEAIKERVEAGASGEGVEEAEAGDEIVPEDDEEDKSLLALQLPFARVTKIIKLNNDLVKISRDACFLMARVTELFVERSVIEAAGTTARAGRKTVMLSDILASMRNSPNPEAMQAFVDELMLPPPKDESKPKPKPKPKRAPIAKKRKDASGEAAPAAKVAKAAAAEAEGA